MGNRTKKIPEPGKICDLKKLLIIYPHWPPSNLAGVHRPRLIANFLPRLGWQPIVLTIQEEYYEETLDPDIAKTIADHVEVHKVKAVHPIKMLGKRVVGDVGLRGFRQLYLAAMRLIEKKEPDFLWIPIPSFYVALLGRLIYRKTGLPYGIDYIDPWVSKLASYDRPLSKGWWSLQLAKLLEPVAVKKAILISGVSTPYYQAVLDRNFQQAPIIHREMPYGFDPADHSVKLKNLALPWENGRPVKAILYAGAFLPQSHLFVDVLFKVISQLKAEPSWDPSLRLYFLGTGHYSGKQLKDYAADHGIASIVHEINDRFPYLHILNFLAKAWGVMVIGSTEKHYTASKTFQSLLSERPVFAMFHKESSAVEVMEEVDGAAYAVKYNEEQTLAALESLTGEKFRAFIQQKTTWKPQLSKLEPYSALKSAEVLVDGIETALKIKNVANKDV